MNRFLEQLKEKCVESGIFPEEAFEFDVNAFDSVREPGWYFIDWYYHWYNDQVTKVIDVVDPAGDRLAKKFLANNTNSHLSRRIAGDVHQVINESESYLVRVDIPEDELALAYLTV